jgi:hypothetical protein
VKLSTRSFDMDFLEAASDYETQFVTPYE